MLTPETMNAARDLFLLLVVSLLYLAPVHLFLTYRLRQAARRTSGRPYVPLTDPWVPAVVALTGLVLVGILWAVR